MVLMDISLLQYDDATTFDFAGLLVHLARARNAEAQCELNLYSYTVAQMKVKFCGGEDLIGWFVTFQDTSK